MYVYIRVHMYVHICMYLHILMNAFVSIMEPKRKKNKLKKMHLYVVHYTTS